MKCFVFPVMDIDFLYYFLIVLEQHFAIGVFVRQ